MKMSSIQFQKLKSNSANKVIDPLDDTKSSPMSTDISSSPKPPQECYPVIQNIVSTSTFIQEGEFKLKDLSMKIRNSEYNGNRFPALVVRIREPKATAMIFKSGKVVCLGANSTDNALLATRKVAKMISLYVDNVAVRNYKIVNVVASSNMKFKVRLHDLLYEHAEFAKYDPEVFPGLVYKVNTKVNNEKINIKILTFHSGKIVITGAKSREQVEGVFEEFYWMAKKFEFSN